MVPSSLHTISDLPEEQKPQFEKEVVKQHLIVGIQKLDICVFDPSQETLKIHNVENS